jgi:release factor glutamine methyltransferase
MKKDFSQLVAELSKKLLPVTKTEQAAQAESGWLLEKVTGEKESDLISLDEIKLSPEQQDKLDKFVTQRVNEKKPLQYILGSVPFCNLDILVEPPILIPRPETEEWCAWLIKKLEPVKKEKLTILDVGAGSGCIALALSNAFKNSEVIGIDIHEGAIALCEKNKKHNGIKNVKFVLSDLYEKLEEYHDLFDLIVSNPPYISEKDFPQLSEEVTKWEDKTALVAGDYGFAIHKKIITQAPLFLKKQSVLQKHSLPQLLIECGKGQANNVVEIFDEAGFVDIKKEKDLEGVQRWITGRR